MNTLLSGLPILAVVVSLLAGISALRAAWLGLAATLLAVVLAFPVAPASVWPAVVRWTPIVLEVLMIIGGGPNRIGQGIEFDCCSTRGHRRIWRAGFVIAPGRVSARCC